MYILTHFLRKIIYGYKKYQSIAFHFLKVRNYPGNQENHTPVTFDPNFQCISASISSENAATEMRSTPIDASWSVLSTLIHNNMTLQMNLKEKLQKPKKMKKWPKWGDRFAWFWDPQSNSRDTGPIQNCQGHRIVSGKINGSENELWNQKLEQK